MGAAKERMMEQQQEREDIKLAADMNITVDEFHQCVYGFEDDTSNDGMVYGTYIVFNTKKSPAHILAKIGLDSLNRFKL